MGSRDEMAECNKLLSASEYRGPNEHMMYDNMPVFPANQKVITMTMNYGDWKGERVAQSETFKSELKIFEEEAQGVLKEIGKKLEIVDFFGNKADKGWWAWVMSWVKQPDIRVTLDTVSGECSDGKSLDQETCENTCVDGTVAICVDGTGADKDTCEMNEGVWTGGTWFVNLGTSWRTLFNGRNAFYGQPTIQMFLSNWEDEDGKLVRTIDEEPLSKTLLHEFLHQLGFNHHLDNIDEVSGVCETTDTGDVAKVATCKAESNETACAANT